MKYTGFSIHGVLVLTICAAILLLGNLHPPTALAISAPAKVAYVEGKVFIKRHQGDGGPEAAEVGSGLFRGDTVITKNGRCQVNLAAAGVLRLSANTTIHFPLEDNPGEKIGVVRMKEGKTWSNIKQLAKDEVFEVRTPTLVAAIQGTKFIVTYDPRTGIATIATINGQVKAIAQDVEKLINQAKQVSADKNGKMRMVIDIDPAKVKEFEDTRFKGVKDDVEGLLLGLTRPLDGGEVSEKQVVLEGTINDPQVRSIDVQISLEGRSQQRPRLEKIQVKDGRFSGRIELLEGKNLIVVTAHGREGRQGRQSLKVSYLPGRAFELKIDQPASGSQTRQDRTVVEGSVQGADVREVSLQVNGADVGKAPVRKGRFRGEVRLVEGKNYIEVSASAARKTARAVSEIRYEKPVENLELSLTSPVDGLVTDSGTLSFQGRLNDVRVDAITVNVNGDTSKVPVRDGSFRGSVTLKSGENRLVFRARNPDGKSVSVERKVRFGSPAGSEGGGDDGIILLTPPTGTTGKAEYEIRGRVTDTAIVSVDVLLNGNRALTIAVRNGEYIGSVRLQDGDNRIELVFRTRDGRSFRRSLNVRYRAGTSGSGVEIAPTPPTLIFEQGSALGAFFLTGTIVADPPVKEINVYADSKLLNRVRVENNQFKAPVQLTDIITQMRVVPIWKNDQEYSAAAAVYKDSNAPSVNISLPIANTRYNNTTIRVDSLPDIINVQGVINDELLKSIQYKINLDTPREITYSGVNVVNFNQPTKLYEGQNTIYVLATDYFGNRSQQSVIVYYEPLKNATVRGKLTDPSGRAVSGAEVQLYPTGGQQVNGLLRTGTLSDGSYSFSNVPVGDYILIIARDHYLPYQRHIKVTGTSTTVSSSLDRAP